jgi:hypothetical protein
MTPKGETGRPLVTFAIPLRRPNSVADRRRLNWTLSQTLRSIFLQTDPDFRVLIATAFEPDLPDFVDDRLEIVAHPGFQPESWDAANLEGGMRRRAMAYRFAELGGEYLMFVDNDDIISRRLVAYVRADRHPHGYIVRHGLIYDATQNVLAPYPMKNFASEDFHLFCGTSAIERLTQEDILGSGDGQTPLYERVHSMGHHHVFDRMAAEDRPMAELPFPAVAYARNTGDNLSRHATEPSEEGARRWIAELDLAVVANKIEYDRALREEFSIADKYLPPEPSRYAFPVPPVGQPSLSVLICTHRRPAGLRRILSSLVPQIESVASREIIVVNDGTHDEHYARVAEEYAAHIRYRALKKNVGIAAARNTAARMAQGDYFVFTDDDCEPPEFWLDWLAALLMEHPELDLVAGSTRPLWPDNPSFFARVRAIHKLIPSPAVSDGTIIFPTAIVAIRRSLFESVGGFGFPDFHGAGEDTELAGRLFVRGVTGVYDPHWYTHHEITEGLIGLCRRYRRYGFANGHLTRLTTSPIAHDFMLTTWNASWPTIWRWEIEGQMRTARAAHRNKLVALASATLGCVVQMAYWRGVKDAFSAHRAPV